MIMQSAFFHLTHIIPDEDSIRYLKESNEHSYGKKGQDVVDMNNRAVDAGMQGIVEVPVPEEWAHATTGGSIARVERPDFVKNVCDVMNRQEGDDLLFPPSPAWKTAHSRPALPSMNARPLLSTFLNGLLKTASNATSALSSAHMQQSVLYSLQKKKKKLLLKDSSSRNSEDQSKASSSASLSIRKTAMAAASALTYARLRRKLLS